MGKMRTCNSTEKAATIAVAVIEDNQPSPSMNSQMRVDISEAQQRAAQQAREFRVCKATEKADITTVASEDVCLLSRLKKIHYLGFYFTEYFIIDDVL